MPPIRLNNFWIVTLTIVGLTGCATEPQAVKTTPPPQQETSFASSDHTRELRLFGQGGITADFEFEAKAATDIQQHTSATEGADFDPAIDPTGKRLVFASTRRSKHSHLYVKPTEGATITQISDEQADDIQPVFCPAGKRIAFASDRAGQWDIYVMDANGRNVRQITNSPMPELHPSWSPDGRQLVYCRVNTQHASGELWIVDLENPGMKRLIGDGLFPTWSPKGNKIAYQRARERGSRWFSIWTLDLLKNDVLYPTEVASSNSAALISPAWSPDGSQIAFSTVARTSVVPASERSPRMDNFEKSDIAVVDTDGRGLQRLTNGKGQNYSPCWSSDDRVYFTARFENHETIWSVKPYRSSSFDEPVINPANRRAASANTVFEQDEVMRNAVKILFGLSALACGCQKEQSAVESCPTLPRSMTFAVSPILNFSGHSDLDPILAADLLASELTQIPGANVIPVSRVMAVLQSHGQMQVESPAQAIRVAEAVGADAIIVAAITEYDAYTPVVGLIVQMYSATPMRTQTLDAVAASRMSQPFEASKMASSYAPSAQVQGTYNAMHEATVDHIKKYASKRDETDYPQGWRQYLHMQSLYLRFCWSDAITNLVNQDSWKLAMVAPLESDHE